MEKKYLFLIIIATMTLSSLFCMSCTSDDEENNNDEIVTPDYPNNIPDGTYIEGNGYQVTWTFGHLCTLKEPHDYTEMWKPWTLSRLPMIPHQA